MEEDSTSGSIIILRCAQNLLLRLQRVRFFAALSMTGALVGKYRSRTCAESAVADNIIEFAIRLGIEWNLFIAHLHGHRGDAATLQDDAAQQRGRGLP